jgi:hypothetical protein
MLLKYANVFACGGVIGCLLGGCFGLAWIRVSSFWQGYSFFGAGWGLIGDSCFK